MRRPTSLHGFTIIELLVVVSIIAMLIAILLPSLARARYSARLVVEASNVRQLTMLTLMYANDNKTALPIGHYYEYPPGTPTSSIADDWVHFRTKTWRLLRDTYGATSRIAACSQWDGLSDFPVLSGPQPYAVNLGWIYFGNRYDVGSDTFTYITPKRLTDARATSNTLYTCLGYSTEGTAWGWSSLVAHPWDYQSSVRTYPASAVVSPPPLGVTVSKTDGSTGWVQHDDLSVYRNVNNLYYSH